MNSPSSETEPRRIRRGSLFIYKNLSYIACFPRLILSIDNHLLICLIYNVFKSSLCIPFTQLPIFD